MAKILFVLTAADHWTLADGTEQPTGYWAEEAIGPYRLFKDAGYDIVAATPGGVAPTVDALSLTADFNGGPEGAQQMQDAVRDATELAHPIRFQDVRLDDYDAVFVPGGWGPMEDLSADAEAGRLMAERLASGRPLALVCHGPAALLTTAGADGTSPFAGYRLTSLTNAEERQNGLADKAKWLLEDRLVELGVDYRAGEPFSPHVEVDRNLLTGQNPASAVPLAQELLNALAAADGDGAANAALVRRIYESKGDPAVLTELASGDFVWDVTPGFPHGGVYHGVEGVGDFFGKLISHVEGWYAEAEEYHPADEGRVFVVGHYQATNNGATTLVRFIHEWTVRDGKLTRMYQAADSAVAQQVVNGDAAIEEPQNTPVPAAASTTGI